MTKNLLTLASAALVVAFASGAPARADVVPPEPETCPDGTTPATCHSGSHCRPNECTTDSDCSGGDVCRDVDYCTRIMSCIGMLPPDTDPTDYDRTVVMTACPASGTCSTGGACEALKVCAAPAVAEPEPDAGGEAGEKERSSGCSAGGGPAGWGALAVVLALVALRRQRQRAA